MSFLISTERRCDGGGLKSNNNYLSIPWVIVRTMSRSHTGEAADLHLPLDVSFEHGLSLAEPNEMQKDSAPQSYLGDKLCAVIW